MKTEPPLRTSTSTSPKTKPSCRSTLPVAAEVTVTSHGCLGAVSYTHLDVYKRQVRLLVEDAPARVAQLADWGVAFDRNADGVDLHREAAHSRARVLLSLIHI